MSSTIPYLSSIKPLLEDGTFPDTNSISTPVTYPQTTTVYNGRISSGSFYILNVLTNTIQPLSSAFSEIIQKYPNQQYDIENNLTNIELFGDTFVLTTSSYVIIDKEIYRDGKFNQSPSSPLIVSSTVNSKASNIYLQNNDLFVCKVDATTSPSTSGSNSREFYVSLKSYNVQSSVITNYNFESASDFTFSYNFNTLVNVTNVNLIYNEKQSLFNIVITYKDLSNNIFLHSIFYRLSNNVVSLVRDKIYQPSNTNFTINFFDGSNVSSLQTQALLTSPVITSSNGTITF